MRWAIPASVGVHLGLIAAAWLFMQSRPEDPSLSEAAVAIDIVAVEEAMSTPSETISEESVNLVSAGMTQAAAEPEEAEAVEPVEVAVAQPAQPVAATVPVTEAVEPAQSEAIASAAVLTALARTDSPVAAPIPLVTADAAPTVAETVAPSDAPILERLEQTAKLAALQPVPEVQQLTTASIAPLTPAKPVESTIPVKVANLTPVEEVAEEVVDAPPVPAPRIVRKPVEAEEKPVEKKPVEKKKAEKPVEKKQAKQVASLGNGGESEADSAAAKASGGTAGKVVTAGKGTLDAYQGKVRSKLVKAVRKPSGSYDGGEARVMFTLDAKGRVLSASLSRSSGDAKVDMAVLAAVERAAPFPPIPEGAGKSTWSFTFPLLIQ